MRKHVKGNGGVSRSLQGALQRFGTARASLLALVALPFACMADAPQPTSAVEQAAINPPLPSDLNLILNAKTTLTIGPFTQVSGDIGSSGVNGSVLFDVSASQSYSRHTLAHTITVRASAYVGRLIGNELTVDGSASERKLGLDPNTLPPVPAVTAATPGTKSVSIAANQSKQLCPGQYNAISLGINSTLNLNGGVYQVNRLTLADGAKLEPSEPVVILVAGNLVTGVGAKILPSAQALNPMSAKDIRIEAGGAITLGDSTQVRAHLLAPNGKLATGKNTSLAGAGWAKIINIGQQSNISSDGIFSVEAPSVPAPCNDNNACTSDLCVSSGTAAYCQNTPVPSQTSCADGNACNGVELCNATGQCQPGTPLGAGTSCADGDVCNGDETCNGIGTCLAGAPPVVHDGNACTADSCDPVTGVSNEPLPDGSACSGLGVCEAGTCSVDGATFSEEFFQYSSPYAQCNSWEDFRAYKLSNGTYGSITMSGTFDLTGVTCSDPAAATQLCRALHNGGTASVSCGGRVWRVGECGGTALSVDSDICSCSYPGRAVRPCNSYYNWGGVSTDTCYAPSQTMTVICE